MPTVIMGRPSTSARDVARAMGIKKLQPGSRFRADVVINWGSTSPEGFPRGASIINSHESVAKAVDKLTTFRVLHEAQVPTVDYTEDRDVARNWILRGNTVYGRELTRGSGGAGIRLYRADNPPNRNEQLPNYPLFTKHWKCDKELRVHVIGGEAVAYSEKKRVKMAVPPPNRFYIRTHDNGWVFARPTANLHPAVAAACVAAVSALKLDFGAVDVRVRGDGSCRILEVNSAPGLEGGRIQVYAEKLRDLVVRQRLQNRRI